MTKCLLTELSDYSKSLSCLQQFQGFFSDTGISFFSLFVTVFEPNLNMNQCLDFDVASIMTLL